MRTLDVSIVHGLEDGARKAFLEFCYYLSPAVMDVEILEKKVRLQLSDKTPYADDLLTMEIVTLIDTIRAERQGGREEILQSHDGMVVSNEDPWLELLANNEVHEVQPGICYLRGKLADALTAVDAIFRDYAVSLGCKEEFYTSLLPARALLENGYVEGFPHHALFVAHAHRTLAAIREVMASAKRREPVSKSLLGDVGFALAPTVCYHCFETMRNGALQNNTLVTGRNLCHRFEPRDAKKLMRLHVFNMREIVFIGTEEFVASTREKILEFCTHVLLEKWNARFRVVTASDPFFATGKEFVALYQKMGRTKIELQMHIPYCDTWLAVMSFNNHQHKLTKTYNIGSDRTASGCFGVGFERLIYGLLCQKGRNFLQQLAHPEFGDVDFTQGKKSRL